jgi:hypothetical protein
MKNILGKLAANDRTHAVTIAVTRGILRLWEAIGAGAKPILGIRHVDNPI